MELPAGKLSPEMLRRNVIGKVGAPSSDVVVMPSIGVDFGVVKLGDQRLIVSSDPITGTTDDIGWYAVNVSANDVATSGNRARFLQSVILLPDGATERTVKRIADDMSRASTSLGVTIVGGHTEVTQGLRRPIVVTTAFAVARSYVTAAGARAGDTIVLTKTAGVEGTAIIGAAPALSRGMVDRRVLARARGFRRMLSVVDEAEAAYGTGVVHAMHDCTEGGVLGAVYEMAVASGVGFRMEEASVPVAWETETVCRALGIDPLRLIGSGSLLIAVESGGERTVADALKKVGSGSTVIGSFTREGLVVRHTGGRRGAEKEWEERLTGSPTDEIWGVLGPSRRRMG